MNLGNTGHLDLKYRDPFTFSSYQQSQIDISIQENPNPSLLDPGLRQDDCPKPRHAGGYQHPGGKAPARPEF
jgi:hypothetical protein